MGRNSAGWSTWTLGGQRRVRIAAVAAALVLAACAAAPASVSPPAGASATASPSMSTEAAASATLATTLPSTVPTALAGPTASSPVAPPVGWTTPQPVGAADTCTSVISPVVAVIDASGTYHLASGCDGRVHYAVSGDGGKTWASTVFQPPANRGELDPQVAVDGNTLYLAYTRVGTSEGCGSNGTSDLGVWYRARTLPSGAWSAATQVGNTDDHIDGLRVVGGTLHAIVVNASNGGTYYETLQGTSYHRYPLAVAYASAPPSLRVGDDGKARIAYQSGTALRYAVFNGSGLSSSSISGSEEGWAPVLVLGQANAAYVLWNRSPEPGGCVTRGPEAADGTYFATNASGAWQTSRLTPTVGEASLTVDVSTGRVFALVSGGSRTPDETDVPAYDGFFYFTKPAGGPWTQTLLLRDQVTSPVIRLDAATGTLLVAYTMMSADASKAQVYAMTKP